MDTTAIMAAVMKRNALRIAAKLPQIDVDYEYRFAVAEAVWEEYERLCQRHAPALARCKERAVTAYRALHGPQCDPGGFGGRMVVGRDTNRRFRSYMRKVM